VATAVDAPKTGGKGFSPGRIAANRSAWTLAWSLAAPLGELGAKILFQPAIANIAPEATVGHR